MSRKAQTDSGETKRSLVASATEEFAEYGYEGASLRQICSKAGVTTGALYFFFDSKEDLFKSVVLSLDDRVSLHSCHVDRARSLCDL
jgi:AcrR family transcriptional regulator